MMRLIGVELTRLRWRRSVLILILAALVIPVLLMATQLWGHRPIEAGDLAQAEKMAAQQMNDPAFKRELKLCEEDPVSYGYAEAGQCEEGMAPKAEWFVDRAPLSVATAFRDTGTAVAILAMMLMLLAGATFVGADWASGSMSNQLLFEPRRTRVWLAKAAAVGLAAALVAAVGQALHWLGIWLAVRAWGIDTPAGEWAKVDGLVLRGVVLVSLAAVLGLALTMLFRSTVATLGILFAVAVAGSLVIMALPLGGTNERWLPTTNLTAWLHHGVDYTVRGRETVCTYDEATGAQDCTGMNTITMWGAAAYLGTILVASIALSLTSFARRDVP